MKWQEVEEEVEEVEEEVEEETNAGASRFQSAHGLCNEDTNPSQPVRTNGGVLKLFFLPFSGVFNEK